jgi:hypothetical protein
VESNDPYLTSLIHYFLRLLVYIDRERLKRRRIHRHRNFLQSGLRRRVAIPPPLLRDEVHKKHLSIDFESQFATPVLARKKYFKP